MERYFVEHSAGLSGADIEAVLTRARMSTALRGAAVVTSEDVQSVIDDFVPPSYPTEIERQNLVAVLDCTSRSLLPDRYRTADRADLTTPAPPKWKLVSAPPLLRDEIQPPQLYVHLQLPPRQPEIGDNILVWEKEFPQHAR